MMEDDIMMEDGEDVMEQDSEAMMMDDHKEMTDDTMINDGSTVMESGAYLAYENTDIALLSGDIVLFFHASWCPTCRALDNDINEHLKDIPGGLSIVKVDYDSHQSLRQQYGVTRQHTLVQVDNQSNKLALWSGSPTLEALVTKVQ